MNTLEVLRTARQNIAGGAPYVFARCAQCTCGHIYTAATGRVARDEACSSDLLESEAFSSAIVEVARALGYTDTPVNLQDAFWWVSDATSEAGVGEEWECDRFDALTVLDRAIAMVSEHEGVEPLAPLPASVMATA